MNSLEYLLDSVILIDHLKSIREAGLFLDQNEWKCAISVVTRAEVLVGVQDEAFQKVGQFLEKFPVLNIDAAVADRAARLRRQYGWKLLDSFQAAIAQIHSLSLVTRNTKDFSPVHHTFVTVPYKL